MPPNADSETPQVDEYAGDREELRRLWPYEKFGPDAHEHWHHDGGYYWHNHRGGREEHVHQVKTKPSPNDGTGA